MIASVRFNLILYVILMFMISSEAKNKAIAKSGPYISGMIKTGPCKKSPRPYDENPGLALNLEVYNTSTGHGLMRGNITVLRQNKNMLLTIKVFFWENEKWNLIYVFHNAGCNSRWLDSVIKMFGIKFENCSVAKGTYVFQGIDSNTIEHLWAAEKDYGRMKWRSESIYKGKTWVCWETETETLPL